MDRRVTRALVTRILKLVEREDFLLWGWSFVDTKE